VSINYATDFGMLKFRSEQIAPGYDEGNSTWSNTGTADFEMKLRDKNLAMYEAMQWPHEQNWDEFLVDYLILKYGKHFAGYRFSEQEEKFGLPQLEVLQSDDDKGLMLFKLAQQ
jgi:hypothetical protein